jgi:hypothetical protein
VRRAALAVAALALAGTGSAAARAPQPARLQVVAREFTFTLSRPSIPAGPAIVEVVNLGMDPHDLRLQRIGGARIYGTPLVQPSGRFELDLPRLLPGRYRLWCSVADHRLRGMTATLRVVTKR